MWLKSTILRRMQKEYRRGFAIVMYKMYEKYFKNAGSLCTLFGWDLVL